MHFNKPATETITQHNQALDGLVDLIALVKDPAPLLAVHKMAREETKLTDDQRQKYQEALDYMAAYDKKKEQFDVQIADLNADQALHLNNVEIDRTAMAELRKTLDAQKEQQEAVASGQETRQKKLDDDWKEMQEKYEAAMTPINELRAVAESQIKANEKEADRLAKLKDKLDKRAAVYAKVVAEESSAEE